MARPQLSDASEAYRCGSDALGWIARLSDLHPDVNSLALLQGCVAATICADLGIGSAPEIVDRFARALSEVKLAALAPCGGTTVLLAALAVSRQLGDLPDSLEQYVKIALAERPTGGVCEPVAFLLGQFDGTANPGQTKLTLQANHLLGAPKETIRDVALQIARATNFGTARACQPADLSEILDAIVIERLGRYDLEFAATLMRSRYYLDAGETLATSMFRAYVVNQRDSDGSFGIFDREAQLLREWGAVASSAVLLSLPTTLAVLWTLSEMDNPGYRVFRDLGSR